MQRSEKEKPSGLTTKLQTSEGLPLAACDAIQTAALLPNDL